MLNELKPKEIVTMNIDIQAAIMSSIRTEKNVMDFYKAGAAKMQDGNARRVFELLAREEREHAGQFYRYYRGNEIPSLEVFLDAAPEDSKLMSALQKLIGADFSEKRALELAMDREIELEKSLLDTAESISDAEVRSVFELNARETHNHYLLIEAEYSRLMGMVDDSEMDTFVRE
jgi:rubrerythrin